MRRRFGRTLYFDDGDGAVDRFQFDAVCAVVHAAGNTAADESLPDRNVKNASNAAVDGFPFQDKGRVAVQFDPDSAIDAAGG